MASAIALAVASLVSLATAPAALAQPRAAPDGVVVLDQERIFRESAYGARVERDLDTVGRALAAENRAIEAALTAEELELTQLRATLPRDEFQILAEDFDIRVERFRAEQDAKGRALAAAADRAQQRFFELIVPILLELVQDRGAAVILDSRSVLLSAEAVDITDAAMERINTDLGDGGSDPVLGIEIDPETGAPVVPEGALAPPAQEDPAGNGPATAPGGAGDQSEP